MNSSGSTPNKQEMVVAEFDFSMEPVPSFGRSCGGWVRVVTTLAKRVGPRIQKRRLASCG
jgi:hypothetical protein